MTQSTPSQTVTQTFGSTSFSWEEHTPLRFDAVSRYGRGEPDYPESFDLSDLAVGFEVTFLLSLKDLVMQRHLKIKAITMRKEYSSVLRLLKKIQSHQMSSDPKERLMEGGRISVIDAGLMVAITAKLAEDGAWIHGTCIDCLKDWFLYVGNGTVFKDLERGGFPTTDRSGAENLLRQKIIALALSRTVQVAVLVDLERRFQVGSVHLGAYVLWNLTNFLYARPESLRQIRCGDLVYGESDGTAEIRCTLWVRPAKRSGRRPKPMAYPVTPLLGSLLFKQQAWVFENVGPLYGLTEGIEPEQRKAIEQRLALFPRINAGQRKDFEIKHFGMLQTGGELSSNYLLPIQRGLTDVKVNFNAMRHTIGTQLAAAGVSAAVIQAVLRHANEETARRYIDLAAKELRDKLSGGLEALETLFPAYGAFMNAVQARAMARDQPERAINSRGRIDPATGEIEIQTTGGCGKTAACVYAPLSCYGCWRWIANIDADHTVNLRFVQDRIKESEALGKPMQAIVDRDRLLEKVIMLRIAQIDKYKAESAQELDSERGAVE
jgi:hypothetical protein